MEAGRFTHHEQLSKFVYILQASLPLQRLSHDRYHTQDQGAEIITQLIPLHWRSDVYRNSPTAKLVEILSTVSNIKHTKEHWHYAFILRNSRNGHIKTESTELLRVIKP